MTHPSSPSPNATSTLVAHKVHGTALRWLYRILAPRHPRGWLDFHRLVDPTKPDVLSIHCHGMVRWDRWNIEVVDVPADLGGFAHGIMFDIVGYMKNQRAIQPDETLGGAFVCPDQIVAHKCSFRRVRRDDEPVEKEFLRVVDLNEPPDSGFPKKLFVAHLLALAEKERNLQRKLFMLRRSVEIFPGTPNAGPDDESAAADNPGNFFSWHALGDALCDDGKTEMGLQALRTAVDRWPCGARKNAQMIKEAIARGELPPADKDPRARFWTGVAETAS